MRSRRIPVAAAVVLLLAACAGYAWWRALPYVPPSDQAAASSSVERQMAYVERWYDGRNPAFGDLAGTDCVNFASQALVARGWAMDGDWGTSITLGRRAYAPAWSARPR